MGISINTKRAHKVRHLGDLTVILTWVNDERALVLLPTHRPGAPWYIVMDSAAWQYDSMAYLARASIKAAEVLGMQGSETKIGTILHDHLGDLVTMPSAPPVEKTKATFGELRAKADGQLIGGEEIRMDRAEGPVYG